MNNNLLNSWMKDAIDEFGVDMIFCQACDFIHENDSTCQWSD
jgi:hypothetical protein